MNIIKVYLFSGHMTSLDPDSPRAQMAEMVPLGLAFIAVVFPLVIIAMYFELRTHKGTKRYLIELAKLIILIVFFTAFLIVWCILYFSDPINQELLKS